MPEPRDDPIRELADHVQAIDRKHTDLLGELFGRRQYADGGGRFGELSRQLTGIDSRMSHVEDDLERISTKGVKRDLSVAVELLKIVAAVVVLVVGSIITAHFVGHP